MPAPPADEVYRGVTRIFSVVIAGFGAAILAVTIARGGSVTSFGILIGVVFLCLGLARLYLAVRARD
jgi:hypothetical protein